MEIYHGAPFVFHVTKRDITAELRPTMAGTNIGERKQARNGMLLLRL